MKKIIEAGNLPEYTKVYLVKGWTGWRTVDPIIDPETGKFNKKNFLNKKGFLTLIILLLIIGIGYLAFNEQIENYKMVINNPCEFCVDCYLSKTNSGLDSGGEEEMDFKNYEFTNPIIKNG